MPTSVTEVTRVRERVAYAPPSAAAAAGDAAPAHQRGRRTIIACVWHCAVSMCARVCNGSGGNDFAPPPGIGRACQPEPPPARHQQQTI